MTFWQKKSFDGAEIAAGAAAAAPLLAGFLVVPSLLFEAGMNFMGACLAYGITALLGTLVLAAHRLPLVACPSAAVSAWLVYVVILAKGLGWQQLLMVFVVTAIAGFVLLLSGTAEKLLEAVPYPVRRMLPGGLGLMLVVYGLGESRILTGSTWSLTMLGDFSDPLAFYGFLGIVIMAVLLAMRIRTALFWSMIAVAILSLAEGFWAVPDAPFFEPEGLDRTAFMADFGTILTDGKTALLALGTALTLLLVLLIESWGTLAAAVPDGDASKRNRLLSELFGVSCFGALLGSVPLSLSPLSLTSKFAGGKGRTAAFTAAVFLVLACFAEPFIKALGEFPALMVPVLVGSGILCLRQSLDGSWRDAAWPDLFSAVCVLLLPALSWNLTAGIGAGVISWVILQPFAGGKVKVTRAQQFLAAVFLAYFLFAAV